MKAEIERVLWLRQCEAVVAQVTNTSTHVLRSDRSHPSTKCCSDVLLSVETGPPSIDVLRVSQFMAVRPVLLSIAVRSAGAQECACPGDCVCGCTSNHVFSPQRFASCFWYEVPSTTSCHKSLGFDAIPKHAEWVARLHWPDDNSNVVLLSVGVDRHVRCSLLQNFAYGDIWEKGRQNGRMPQTSRRISIESLQIVQQARSTHPSYCLSTLCAPGSVEQL